MAKRYKEEATEQESTDFKIPPFDEKAYITREKRNIKTIFISFILGIVIAVISFGFWVLLTGSFLRWELVLLFGLFNMPWLRYIFIKLHIDLTDFSRTKWLTAYATYFFTWLLIFIVIVNPPFYDDEAPQIQAVALPGLQAPSGTVIIAATITDNVKVQTVSLTYTDPQGTTHTPTVNPVNGVLTYTFNQANESLGKYNYTITATDASGHKTTQNGNFTYTNSPINLTSFRTTDLSNSDLITFKADPRISHEAFRVYYRLDNGKAINATRRNTSDPERYETTPEVQGWTPNSTVTMHVSAEVTHYFTNNPVPYTNNVTISIGPAFTTVSDPTIGTAPDPTPNYSLPKPSLQSATPGFEILVALGALAVVVLVVRKKKKQKQ